MGKNDKNMDLIVAIYNKAMDDIIDRRKVEWQTFLTANLVYGAILKVLIDFESKFMLYQSIMIFTIITLISYIWFIRIYGNAWRTAFSRQLRNNIQNIIRNNDDKIMPNPNAGGGYLWWNRSYFTRGIAGYEKKWGKGGRSWPLWGQKGISIVIIIYWLSFGYVLFCHKTTCSLFSFDYAKFQLSLAMLENESERPISKALQREFKGNNISISKSSRIVKSKKRGWRVISGDKEYYLKRVFDSDNADMIEVAGNIRDIPKNSWIALAISISLILICFLLLDKLVLIRSSGRFLFRVDSPKEKWGKEMLERWRDTKLLVR